MVKLECIKNLVMCTVEIKSFGIQLNETEILITLKSVQTFSNINKYDLHSQTEYFVNTAAKRLKIISKIVLNILRHLLSCLNVFKITLT